MKTNISENFYEDVEKAIEEGKVLFHCRVYCNNDLAKTVHYPYEIKKVRISTGVFRRLFEYVKNW